MKKIITGLYLLLLALAAWHFFSGQKFSTGKSGQTFSKMEDGLVKIPVINIINPSLTGSEDAFTDEPASHSLVNGSSDQSVTPKSCGNWWDFTESTRSSCIQLSYHPNRVGNPGEITYDFEFDGIYKLKKICVFVDPQKKNEPGNKLLIKSGTPFHYNNLVSTINDDGAVSKPAWVDIDCNSETKFIQLVYGENFGSVREIVFYGELVKKDDAKTVAYNFKSVSFDSSIGTNIVMQMGQSADGKNYDEGWSGGLRWFAAACYVLNKDLSLKYFAGTAGDLEANWNERIIKSGSKLHYAFGSLVDSSMVSATNNSGGDWANQKPIPTALVDEGKADKIDGICTFNEIATDPKSYAQAAYNLKRLAAGLYKIGHRSIEPDNEKDGNFKKAGFMLPYQQAAYVSALFDGHDNTILFRGEPVGVRNSGLNSNEMKLIFPGLTYVNPTYIKAMYWWWKFNRKNGDAPFDIFNFHTYCSTFGITDHFRNAQAVMPESSVYELEKKLDTVKYFAALMNRPVINTETGYDVYDERMRYPTPYCDEKVRWGNSFVAIRPFGGKTAEQIQGEWLLRTYLVHHRKNIYCYQFWLADQHKEGTPCGPFYATGFLKHDTVISWKQLYIPRLSWYYVQCFKKHLAGYNFVSEERKGSMRIYQYENAEKKNALVIWSATQDGTSLKYSQPFKNKKDYRVILPNNTAGGKIISGSGSKVDITVTELPQIILY
ncbi:MAG: hypothetical protein WAT19_15195 [Ferruginibacter sp.]